MKEEKYKHIIYLHTNIDRINDILRDIETSMKHTKNDAPITFGNHGNQVPSDIETMIYKIIQKYYEDKLCDLQTEFEGL